ncbi:MAG TPA: tetratricopeptide repeat-containing glycosyltransferase family protein [Candidatus Didemnitutus sp.]|jgi:Tfp pilus assembly protein PilF
MIQSDDRRATRAAGDTKPDSRAAAEVHFHAGNAFREAGRRDEAMAEFRSALTLDAGMAEAELNLGILLEQDGRLDEAFVCCGRAAANLPDRPEGHLALGNILFRQRRLTEAIPAFQRALQCEPGLFAAWLNLGNAQRLANDLGAAQESFAKAASLKPDSAVAFINLANVHRAQNRLLDSRAAAERALSLDPTRPEAHLNYAMTLLVAGEMKPAWPHAEFRHALKLGGAGRQLPGTQWDGKASLAGRRILLHGEQGYGDSIQFLRYVPLVAALGATIILEVQTPLRDLVAASFPEVGVVLSHGEKLPDFEFHCPLPSLPLAFGTELASIPASVPYLCAPPARVERWRGFFAGQPGLRIGLAWAGNPTHPNDFNRSLSLQALCEALAGISGLRLFSLKKEVMETDAVRLAGPPTIGNLSPHLHDFADTAALVGQMDLIIAVDTAVAHLAGALGRPVWILLPFSPDWRWLLDRSDSPWYPTARLFRQPCTGDWGTPLANLRAALAELTSPRDPAV